MIRSQRPKAFVKWHGKITTRGTRLFATRWFSIILLEFLQHGTLELGEIRKKTDTYIDLEPK